MSPERREFDHGLRMALRAGEKSLSAAHAAWEPVPRKEPAQAPPAPVLKDTPQLGSEEEQVAAVSAAFERAVAHMHDAEDGKAKGVVGAKTYGLSIMHEALGMDAAAICHDDEALSDLTEYLLAMLYGDKGVYLRVRPVAPELQDDPDVRLMQSILNTWELPDREFSPPFMYQRIDWK